MVKDKVMKQNINLINRTQKLSEPVVVDQQPPRQNFFKSAYQMEREKKNGLATPMFQPPQGMSFEK